MLYRSLFLLRISSAFCEENIIDNPSLTKNEFKFWWKNIGFNAGLWSNCHDITYFGDLWDDICIEIENLDLWISQEKGDVNNYRLQNDNKISTLRLSSFERVCLWSIGI